MNHSSLVAQWQSKHLDGLMRPVFHAAQEELLSYTVLRAESVLGGNT